jgi:hypothetical protein
VGTVGFCWRSGTGMVALWKCIILVDRGGVCDLSSCKEGGIGEGIGLERLFPEGGLWVVYGG